MEDIKKILVVTRSTKNCKHAVHLGVSLARKYAAQLYVMNVLTDPFSIKGWNVPVPSLREEYNRVFTRAREEMDEIIRAEKAEGLKITDWIKEGDPVHEVLQVVEDEGIDLLVLLAHEEWRLEHFLFGKTNHELVRMMPCSILLVKQEPMASD